MNFANSFNQYQARQFVRPGLDSNRNMVFLKNIFEKNKKNKRICGLDSNRNMVFMKYTFEKKKKKKKNL